MQLPIALLLAIVGDRMPDFYKEMLFGLTHCAYFHLHLLLYFVCEKKKSNKEKAIKKLN